jgi:hypothetical protein
VPERLGEPVPEVLRQRGAVDVEALQVGVEVFAGAVHVGGAAVLVRRPILAQLGQDCEDFEESGFLGQRPLIVLDRGAAGGEIVVDHPALVVRVEPVSEQQSAQIVLAAPEILGERPRRAGWQRELNRGGSRGIAGSGSADRLQTQQRRAGFDLAAHGDDALLDPARERRPEHVLHFHALQHQHRCAGSDLGAHRHRHGDNERGPGCPDNPALFPADAVRHTVHLDRVCRPLGSRQDAVADVVDGEMPGVAVEAVDLGISPVHPAVGFDADPELARAHPGRS